MVLFAAPFAAVGLFTGWLALSMIADAVEVAGWVETPARILAAELVERPGDDGSTWRVEASYEYVHDGFTYRGDRVGLSESSDNVGSFHRDAYRRLAAHRDSGEPFVAFVDPDDPTRAVLFRRMRWELLGLELLFALVFGGAGFGLMAAAVVGRRRADAEAEARRRHPDEPWRWKRDWADGRVSAGSRWRWIGAAILAAFWSLISAPLLFLVPGELAKGNAGAWLGLVFPGIGVLLLALAARAWLQWRRFGDSTFEMARLPGVVGGILEGRVLTRIGERPPSLHVTLSCIREKVSGSGRDRRRRERVLWQDAARIPRERLQHGPDGVVVPVRFEIPYDVQATTPDAAAAEPVLWRLEVEAELAGVDYEAAFEIPVFRTADSDPGFQPSTPATGAATDTRTLAELAGAGIRLTPLPSGGLRIAVARGRHPGPALALAAFSALWAGFVALLVRLDAPVLFPVVFGGFLLLLLWGLVEMWMVSSRIEAEAGILRFARGVLRRGRPTELPADRIAAIEPARGMQAGRRLYYRIRARDVDGNEHVLATQIDDIDLARRLVAELEAHLGGAGDDGLEEYGNGTVTA